MFAQKSLEWGDLERLQKRCKKIIQFAYRKDGKLVGFASCSKRREYVAGCKSNKVGFLEGIYVLPQHRNQDIATKLFARFEKWAKKMGAMNLLAT